MPRQLEAVGRAEIDVDECHVGTQFGSADKCVSTRRGDADDPETLLFEQCPRGVQEIQAVVDKQAPQGHDRQARAAAPARLRS
ncbi:hypothetical protein GCM10009608_54230 [Pseudonocardia alaniniphila]